MATVASATDAATSAMLTAVDATTSTTLATSEDEAVALLGRDDLSLDSRIATVRAMLEKNPDQADVWAVLGELRQKAGEDEAALAAFQRAVARDPRQFSSWQRIGILKKKNKRDLEGALMAFEKARESGAPKAAVQNDIAITQAQMGRMAEAYASWQSAVAADPDWGVPIANSIKAAIALKNDDAAAENFAKLLKAKRFEETGALMYADHLVRQKRGKAALSVYEKALVVAPSSGRLHYYYAATLREEGRDKDSVPEFEKAIASATADNDVVTRTAAQKGLFALKHKDKMKTLIKAEEIVGSTGADDKKAGEKLGGAIKMMDPIIAEHPELWEPRLMRGIAHRRLGHGVEARADFEAVLVAAPDQANALMNLGLLARDEKDNAKAADYARKALASAPRDPQIAMNAGFIFIDTENCQEARKLIAETASFIPEDALAPLREELAVKCKK